MSVTDHDMGYAELLKRMKRLGSPFVLVGIREEAGSVVPEGTDVTVAEYATANEFGLGVPERSFLRSTVDRNEERYADLMADAVGKVLDGAQGVDQAFGKVGAIAVRDVVNTIRDFTDPPNAPSTIKLKGSSSPLQDTGRMRQSIDHEVRDAGADDIEPGVGHEGAA